MEEHGLRRRIGDFDHVVTGGLGCSRRLRTEEERFFLTSEVRENDTCRDKGTTRAGTTYRCWGS